MRKATLRAAWVTIAISVPAAGQGMASRGVKPLARPAPSGRPWNSTLTNIASQAGLKARTIYGPESDVQYISETSSGGIAVLDYDRDGWPDVFIVSGTRFGEHHPRPPTGSTAISTTELLPMSPRRPA